MIRTQIYITSKEKKALTQIAAQTGQSQSELIRKAIDLLLSQSQHQHRLHLLRGAKGIWKDQKNKSEQDKLRKEMDRDFS